MTRLLWTLALGVFAGALDLSVLSPALPALGRTFTVQTGDLAWVFTLYLLVTVVSIAVASSMADRYGRRPIYLICISLFAAGSVVAIVAPNYGIFLAARAIQALGAGGIFPVATAA
ncbi:MAG: MFS transporter, partial [Candidatus Cybelea sp.]